MKAAFIALIVALFALPARAAEPIPLHPWIGKLYADFGLNLFYPSGASLEDNLEGMAPRDGRQRTLRVWIDLAGGREFRAVMLDYDREDDWYGADDALAQYIEGRGVVGLREVPRSLGRGWLFERVQEGRRIRTHFIAVPPRYVILESIGPAARPLDPGTDRFLTDAMVLPR